MDDEKLYGVANTICMRECEKRFKTTNDDDLNDIFNFW